MPENLPDRINPIPVRAASSIADAYSQDMVVVVSSADPHDHRNITAYGRRGIDKLFANAIAEQISWIFGNREIPLIAKEDARNPVEAELMAEKKELVDMIERLVDCCILKDGRLLETDALVIEAEALLRKHGAID